MNSSNLEVVSKIEYEFYLFFGRHRFPNVSDDIYGHAKALYVNHRLNWETKYGGIYEIGLGVCFLSIVLIPLGFFFQLLKERNEKEARAIVIDLIGDYFVP